MQLENPVSSDKCGSKKKVAVRGHVGTTVLTQDLGSSSFLFIWCF